MANPLMKGMLNNILLKEGKGQPESAVPQTEGQPANLRKHEENLLVSNILKNKSSVGCNEAKAYTQPARQMVTLEQLRKPNKSPVRAEADKEKARDAAFVTLASIGKLNKR